MPKIPSLTLQLGLPPSNVSLDTSLLCFPGLGSHLKCLLWMIGLEEVNRSGTMLMSVSSGLYDLKRSKLIDTDVHILSISQVKWCGFPLVTYA